ncbi:MAG: hypothetical protein ACRDF4_04125 [Rhabdochlamydiaceae bacterium]
MSIDPNQFKNLIVTPVLSLLEKELQIPHTTFVSDLLIATAAQESLCGRYLRQIYGPAVSIYQFEFATFQSAVNLFRDRWSASTQEMLFESLGGRTQQSPLDLFEDSLSNLKLATCFARLIYFCSPLPLPIDPSETNYLTKLWIAYKAIWNTKYGSATKEEFNNNITKFTHIYLA